MKTSIVIDVIYEKNAAPHYLNSKFDAVSYEGALVESFTEFLKNDSIGDVTGVVSSCVVRSETTKESHRALREPVRWFAEQMERKLRRNDANRGEDGWKDMSIWALLNSANAEIAEFRKAMADVDKWEDAASNMARMGLRVEGGEDALGRVTRDLVEKVVRELADASNYLMMMADILRKKYLTDKKESLPVSCDLCSHHLMNAGTSYECSYPSKEVILPHYPVRPAKCPLVSKGKE